MITTLMVDGDYSLLLKVHKYDVKYYPKTDLQEKLLLCQFSDMYMVCSITNALKIDFFLRIFTFFIFLILINTGNKGHLLYR